MVRVTTSHITSTREAGDGDAAQDHQHVFERIERAPFQVALLLQDQAVEAAIGHFRIVAAKRGTGGSRAASRLT